jgi:hypothetical protein
MSLCCEGCEERVEGRDKQLECRPLKTSRTPVMSCRPHCSNGHLAWRKSSYALPEAASHFLHSGLANHPDCD